MLQISPGLNLLQPYCNPSGYSLIHRVSEPIAHAGQHVTLALCGRSWFGRMASRRWEKITSTGPA